MKAPVNLLAGAFFCLLTSKNRNYSIYLWWCWCRSVRPRCDW